MHFETKVAIVVREDLADWQKLNVTSFLTSGVIGANAELLGADYEDAEGNAYTPLLIQPVMVLCCDGVGLKKIYRRAMDRGVRLSLYIDEMFSTGHDAAKREAVINKRPEEMVIAGLALREARKLVDKITKGAKLHP
ncbi:MAG: DUF2000 family protein [Pseudomonadota bacterium]|nr:DUF2000 family protein [Pseudomonadota bacterium]